MSSSVLSPSTLHFAGCLLRRSKKLQLLGFPTYKYDCGKGISHFTGLLSAHLQPSSRLNQRSLATNNILEIKMRCLTTWSTATTVGSPATFNRLFSRNSYALYFLCVQPTFQDFSIASKVPLRFINNQRCSSKTFKVLSNRETKSLGKILSNSRRNSEKAGEKSTVNKNIEDIPLPENPKTEEKKLTLYQRFKKTYKEHGKVLVAVHVATSLVWFGSFYTAASLGFDIVPLLESWNMSEKVISPFRSGGLGNVALAYLLYKLATPARYTVTIAGTNFAIKYLQKEGKMKVVPKADSLRSLYNEGKEDIKGRSKKRMTMIRRKARARRKQRNNNEEYSEKP